MNEKNTKYLFEKYNELFRGRNEPITENLMSFGFDCISEGSKILMSDFSQKKIEDIKIGDKIIGVQRDKEGKQYKLTNAFVLNKFEKGIKNCIDISNTNNKLSLTEEHEVLCYSYNDRFVWRKAGLINKNHLPISFSILPKNKDFYKGWVIGLFESDGYIINKTETSKYCGIKLNNIDLISEYDKCLKKFFNIYIKDIKKTTYIKNSKNSKIYKKYTTCHNRKLYVATIYKKKDVKKILDYLSIDNKSNEFLRGWLAGFIDGDGSVYKNCIKIYQKNKIKKLEKVLNLLNIEYKKYPSKEGVFIYYISTCFNFLINSTPFLKKNKWEGASLRLQPREPINKNNKKEKRKVYDLTTTCSNFIANGFIVHNCDDGWTNLLDELCNKIYTHCRENHLDIPKVVQVKEKFGGLRFYINSYPDDYVDTLIEEYEGISEKTCEVCGNPGKIKSVNHWVMCRCDDCLI